MQTATGAEMASAIMVKHSIPALLTVCLQKGILIIAVMSPVVSMMETVSLGNAPLA